MKEGGVVQNIFYPLCFCVKPDGLSVEQTKLRNTLEYQHKEVLLFCSAKVNNAVPVTPYEDCPSVFRDLRHLGYYIFWCSIVTEKLSAFSSFGSSVITRRRSFMRVLSFQEGTSSFS